MLILNIQQSWSFERANDIGGISNLKPMQLLLHIDISVSGIQDPRLVPYFVFPCNAHDLVSRRPIMQSK
jgi:hypothetical protein